MLTSEVKQRINTCRDILVGKLPDPKSQVIQITNALIYKFMDDQDRLSEKMGGKASFFTGTLKPYAWHKLFDTKLTNHERADLYVNGIERLSGAQNLPELFREIFKEAYVPFKAAGTITLFIEEINKFSYHHSEELGNAYEYLLSIMGSQGDAGQFRTPRHIIEFMVDVIDPQKTETVYDPACGTAGFLIAAYTHIAEANNGKLTASEKKKLAENISGIDISPDMAKMARVNLYLHGFTSPVINEGDTLSDEDLWGTKYDVILANPPFMSPTGGIIPHDKFGIKAKRAEVLFVDYIAEHLKLMGRAAIVVPEGVIFQSGTTYKALRKMLVEDGYLHSVISLPAGVFQPYSGVKTSILILDRERAKEATEVLFLKIENDGFAINTQRSERSGSQLEEALAVARAWQEGKKQDASFASWVGKSEIAESGDYNLTGERYRAFEAKTSSWPLVSIGEVSDINPPKSLLQNTDKETLVSFVPMECLSESSSVFTEKEKKTLGEVLNKYTYFENGDVLLAKVTPCFENGKAGIAANLTGGVGFGSSEFFVLRPSKRILANYLYQFIASKSFRLVGRGQMTGTGGLQRISKSFVTDYKIPLPPIEVQQEIVAELDRYQKIIDGARQVVENWRPKLPGNSTWEKARLEAVCEISSSLVDPKDLAYSNYLHVGGANIEAQNGRLINLKTAKEEGLISGKYLFDDGMVIYSKIRPYLVKVARPNFKGLCSADIYPLSPFSDKISKDYLFYLLISQEFTDYAIAGSSRAGMPKVNRGYLFDYSFSLPPLETQKNIVDDLEASLELVEYTKKLIDLYELKIQDKIAEVWGE